MKDPIEFMLFDVNTRRLLEGRKSASTIHVVELQCHADPNLGWVFGHWDAATHYVDENGEVRESEAPLPELPLARDDPEPVTTAEVDAQTARRIESRYRLVDQINALRGDGDVDFAWVDAVRAAGRRLKAMTPIPADYADDKHWPHQ